MIAAANPFWIDSPTPGRLATMRKPLGGQRLAKEIAQLHAAGVDVLVSLLEPHEVFLFDLRDEESACRTNGIRFISFPIPDFGLPESRQDALALADTLSAELKQGNNLVIHCHGGIGRSTMVAAAVLIRLGLDPDGAMDRISTARGFRVPETPEQVEWIKSAAE